MAPLGVVSQDMGSSVSRPKALSAAILAGRGVRGAGKDSFDDDMD